MKKAFSLLAYLLGVASSCALTVASHGAHAEIYPSRAVYLVVPFAAGGPTDVLARTLAAAMTRPLGQTVIVENKPGAGGTLGATAVAKATPDGYKLLIHHNGMATAPALYRKLGFNPLVDFEYIGRVADVPMTLIGRADLPPKDGRPLLAYIRANSKDLNLANAGLGAVSHLCGMLLQKALGVDLTTVPYQGTGPALTALLGAQVDLLCDQTTQTLPHIKSGKVKLYGVTTRARIGPLPTTPTMQELGLKDFEVVVWHGLYAPKGTPKEALGKINSALKLALKDPVVAKRLAELGADISPESEQTPGALGNWLKAEIDRWTPVIHAAGVYAD